MKIDRLIGILTILMQKERVTAPELAKRFEVSRRTITRDLDVLCKAGVPIITTQGHAGGISVVQGYKINTTIFTYEELHNIMAGLKGLESVTGKSIESVYNKFKLDKCKVFSEHNFMLIDLASFYQDTLIPKIESFKKAIKEKHRVQFNYYYSKGDARKEIEPYFIVFKWSSWYIYGFCIDNQNFRLYKINRLYSIQITAHRYEYRHLDLEDINFDGYFEQSGIAFEGLFDSSQKYKLIEEYGINSYTENENGDLYFKWEFIQYDTLFSWILGFGSKVKVIKPDFLIEDIKQTAQNLTLMYNSNS